jgi:hypothetical protein
MPPFRAFCLEGFLDSVLNQSRLRSNQHNHVDLKVGFDSQKAFESTLIVAQLAEN